MTKEEERRATEVRRSDSVELLKSCASIRAPLSAGRPDLGCSLPGLAGFACQTPKTVSLRKPHGDRQPQETDIHRFGNGSANGLKRLIPSFQPVL